MNITKEELEKAAEAKLAEMMREDPFSVYTWMLAKAGNTIVETGAGEMELKTKATYDNVRYEVKAVIKVKKVKS